MTATEEMQAQIEDALTLVTSPVNGGCGCSTRVVHYMQDGYWIDIYTTKHCTSYYLPHLLAAGVTDLRSTVISNLYTLHRIELHHV